MSSVGIRKCDAPIFIPSQFAPQVVLVMLSGSYRRGFKYSCAGWPVTFLMIALNIKLAPELYINWLPGLKTTGRLRNVFPREHPRAMPLRSGSNLFRDQPTCSANA